MAEDSASVLFGTHYSSLFRVGYSIDLVFKIAAIGILIAVLYQLLVRSGREDIAMMVSIAGLVIVLLMVVNLVSDLFSSVKSIFGLY